MTNLVQIRGSKPIAASASASVDEPTSPSGPRIYMETFGCQMNEADTALVLGRLGDDGWQRVDDPGAADLVLINTCAVREKAEDRVYGRTTQLLDYRADNPDLVIGITGCMAEHLREKLETRAPHIALVAGPDSYRNIAALARQAIAGRRVVDVELDKAETYEGLDGHAEPDAVSGFVTVQRGCDKFCTFCVVPFTRGRERGVPPREVLRQVRRLAEQGVREVTLLGQTVNSYVWEDVDFADLLRAVAQIEGIARIRFTSPYPIDFSPRVIEVLASEPKVAPYVHLPVQSGSDPVLERMRRGYDVATYLRLVEDLRRAVPGIAISTDLMVGFCGETDEDHARTLELMRTVEYDFAFMFAYSDREITYASKKLVDDVPHAIKQARLREVIELQELHTRAKHAARIGTDEAVLVSAISRRKDRLVGRTARFQKVLMPLGAAEIGEIVVRRISGSTGHSLISE
ncbi:tRNA (N6-isopentenyl adenosine(37)-C2)-methylthiotransferase MiaB [Nannocystaceae bacterium ST9]